MNRPQMTDQAERLAASDPHRSFIVQAPAGSGKTELLIQRFLALLAVVERPQQILAITFTRKAAAEMRNRLLDALTSAQQPCPEEKHKARTWQLARQALQRDRAQNWNLLQNPARLSIQTIDSLNSSLVRKMPWLSRFGGVPELTRDADNLYLKATERLLLRLGTDKPGGESLTLLLAHIDNRMDRLQQMLVAMLRNRDQWLRHLGNIRAVPARQQLEAALTRLVEQQLHELHALTPWPLADEMLACGRIAAANLMQNRERPLFCLTDLEWFPGGQIDHLPLWQGLADLLLTTGNELRKARGVDARCGFPAAEPGARERMQHLVSQLEGETAFLNGLAACRELPGAAYPPEQWTVLEALIELLPILVAELWLVFRGEGTSDFAEIALMATAALGSSDDPSDLLLKIDNRLEHILVDEFQDTSWLQYGLLETLTAGWQEGDGRTLFLVGDPMQSIYRFREAEVGLFLKTFAGDFGTHGLKLEPLRLLNNYRSQQGIVAWVNRVFAGVFPAQVDVARGAVPLAPANPVQGSLPGVAVSLSACRGRDDRAEAQAVAALLEEALKEDPQQTLAILVRSRTHLPVILRLLREKGVRYQAQDIELLGSQPVALDLISLTRALLHPADRLAWLTILRAPWCGLTLSDLGALVAHSPEGTVPGLLRHKESVIRLSADGQLRVARIWPLMERFLSLRGEIPLRQLVESCWLALGGPACYGPDGVADAALVFELVESLQDSGDLTSLDSLEAGLAGLFAVPDPGADGRLQVMTIHKAKGLEFDQVILPGLGRKPAGNDSPLLRWLEHPQVGLLLAPIAARDGSEQDPIYRMIGRLEKEKQDLESSRLLYVAATRAKSRLHLLGHAEVTAQEDLKPAAGSLLEKLWPILGPDFCREAQMFAETAICPEDLKLRRLPVDWQMPELKTLALPQIAEPGVAAAQDSPAEEHHLFSGWEQQSRRHVGTLIHQVFEKIVRKGPGFWVTGGRNLDKLLRRQLAGSGVPQSELENAMQRIRLAIEQTLKSDRGQWILQRHKKDFCEFAISGQLDGQMVHAVIDRTFIDQDGVCWVIDYKTSSPGAAEDLPAFLQRETDHYRPQLENYVRLLQRYDPQPEMRAALYFPLIDCFVEVEHANSL